MVNSSYIIIVDLWQDPCSRVVIIGFMNQQHHSGTTEEGNYSYLLLNMAAGWPRTCQILRTNVQYIQRVVVRLSFVLLWLRKLSIMPIFFRVTSRVLGIAPVPVKQPWRIWVNAPDESIKSDIKTMTKQHWKLKSCCVKIIGSILARSWHYAACLHIDIAMALQAVPSNAFSFMWWRFFVS